MGKILIQLLLSASPVIVAAIFHMIIVKLHWFKSFSYPLDHYRHFQGKRIFGDHKTYRGLLVMIVFSIAFTYLYFLLLKYQYLSSDNNLLDFSNYSVLTYGMIFGVGYVFGELPNSFMKRQLNIDSGKANHFWLHLLDQIDSVLLIMLLLVFFSDFNWIHFVVGVFFYGFIHLSINYILFLVGLRKEAF